MIRMSLVKAEAPLDEGSRYYWSGGPITACTSAVTVTALTDAQNSGDWGEGVNNFELQLFDPFDMRLLASNSSNFHVHLTNGLNYSVLQGLQGRALIAGAAPALAAAGFVSGADKRTRIFIPTSFFFNINEWHLKVLRKSGSSSSRMQTKLTIFMLSPSPSLAPSELWQKNAYLKSQQVLALFTAAEPDSSIFDVSVQQVQVDTQLTAWAGRPKADADFRAQDQYRTDYIAWERAWRQFAEAPAAEGGMGDDEWAVLLRSDIMLNPNTRDQHTQARDRSSRARAHARTHAADATASAGGWLQQVLLDLFALSDGEGFAWLGVCGYLPHLSWRPPDADVLLPRNVTSPHTIMTRVTGPFPLAFASKFLNVSVSLPHVPVPVPVSSLSLSLSFSNRAFNCC